MNRINYGADSQVRRICGWRRDIHKLIGDIWKKPERLSAADDLGNGNRTEIAAVETVR